MERLYKVHGNVRKEIPDFIIDNILYCDNITLLQNQRSCLVLTKNLQFFEFQRKRLIHCIDLKDSCLGKELNRLSNYDGPKGKWFDETETNDLSLLNTSHDINRTLNDECKPDNSDVSFGKYIYRNQDIKRVYLFIKCWDKLVVLERNNNLSIVSEYDKVLGFKLVNGKINYQVVVELHFLNGTKSLTDFNEKDSFGMDGGSIGQKQTPAKLKEILERIRNVKTELQLHKGISQKEIAKLQNFQAFGSNYLRTLKLEEKQMLARCGDVWIRITPYDHLVFGVPLINNCGSGNYKVFKNLKPLIVNNSDCNSLSYDYKIYKLKQTFENLESLESFFQSEDEELQEDTWTIDTTRTLMPQSTCILIVAIKIPCLLLKRDLPVSLYFEVEKQYRDNEPEVFDQQIFLKTFDIDEILKCRKNYEISFKNKTFHQDFLAIAMCSLDLKLLIEFINRNDLDIFHNLLLARFDFKLIDQASSSHPDESTAITIEHNDRASSSSKALYYNDKPSSLWYGMMILRDSSSETELTFWKVFTSSEEKLSIFLKILFDDLILQDCNIKAIECPSLSRPRDDKISILEFENCIRQELATSMGQFNNDVSHNLKKIASMQLKTDLIASQMEK